MSDAMEQVATAVAVPVADDRGTKRGFSPAGLDADSKRPAVVHDAYKETADGGLTRPIIIAALAKAHKGPSKKEFTELGITAATTREQLLRHLHATAFACAAPGGIVTGTLPRYMLTTEAQEEPVANRMRDATGGDKGVSVRAIWTAAGGWKLQKQLDCVEELREQAVALQQEMIDERERQASWQRHRWLKDRAKNREPRPPEPMSADTSLPSNFDSWSHVFAVKGRNRAHTHALGRNAVDESAQEINNLLETCVGAASVDSSGQERGTFQVTDEYGCSLVPASVLAGGAGRGKPLFGDDGNLIRYARAEHLARTNEPLPTELFPGEEDEIMPIEGFPTAEEQRKAGEQWEKSQAGNDENQPGSLTDNEWNEHHAKNVARDAAVDGLEQLLEDLSSYDLPVTDFDPR